MLYNDSKDENLQEIGEEMENKSIQRIVLTGGPCAGKTTALAKLEQTLSNLGYKVVVVPEAATMLIGSGIRPKPDDNREFQKRVFEAQIALEEIWTRHCEECDDKKIILLFDRGIMDSKAYCSALLWSQLLKGDSVSEVALRDKRYDAVFHLVTAAKGAEEFYTLATNAARCETAEQARTADTKTLRAWTGHPHLRMIDNSSNFDGKMLKLLQEVTHFLGEPQPFEIERKFLIENPQAYLDRCDNCTKVEILQTYLKSDHPNEEVRVRQRGIDGEYQYTKTTKRQLSGATRFETEERITQQEYLTLLMEADPKLKPVRKTRYCLIHENQYLEVDIYPGSQNAILEVELSHEDQDIIFPLYLSIIKEVTEDKRFKNNSLAKEFPEELRMGQDF